MVVILILHVFGQMMATGHIGSVATGILGLLQ